MSQLMNVQIRPAQKTDASAILGLIQELADYERLTDEVVATVESLQQTLFGEQRAAECLLAERTGSIVGMAIFFTSYSTFLAQPGLYLEDLYVQPDSRGLGIGKALLQAVAQRAVERNCGRLEWSVLDWNQPAIEFYESLGARAMNEWTVYRLTGPELLAMGQNESGTA